MSDPEIPPGLEGVMSYHTDFDLRHGDCIAGMKVLPEESVDIVVTSPPYNLGIKYKDYDDNLSSDDYLAWSLEWAGEVERLLKSKGSFFLNVGASPANPWMPHELALKLRNLFQLKIPFTGSNPLPSNQERLTLCR